MWFNSGLRNDIVWQQHYQKLTKMLKFHRKKERGEKSNGKRKGKEGSKEEETGK